MSIIVIDISDNVIYLRIFLLYNLYYLICKKQISIFLFPIYIDNDQTYN